MLISARFGRLVGLLFAGALAITGCTTGTPARQVEPSAVTAVAAGASSGDTLAVASQQVVISSDTLPLPEGQPELGEIVFAPAVADTFEPIDPGILFSAGLTQIHAVFTYRGMSPADTWERVWTVNDQEVARRADPWTEPAEGIFDYAIDNGGQPLPPGDYVLAIYVNGKLESLGVFIIE
jgi:hypothetical protein